MVENYAWQLQRKETHSMDKDTNNVTAYGRQAMGFLVGAILSRYIIQGEGADQELADVINKETLSRYLRRVAEGDLIIQDQLLSGKSFDPEMEAYFQNLAKEIHKVLGESLLSHGKIDIPETTEERFDEDSSYSSED